MNIVKVWRICLRNTAPWLGKIQIFTGFSPVQSSPRELLPEGLETWVGTPFYLVTGHDPIKGQALWAFAHGMAILEIDARFAGPSNGSPADGVWEIGALAFDTQVFDQG